jgi:hypothetical protein
MLEKVSDVITITGIVLIFLLASKSIDCMCVTLGSAESDTGLSRNSSVTVKDVVIPIGNFSATVQWGNVSRTMSIISDGSPRSIKVEFPFTNLRKSLKFSIYGENGSLVELELIPSLIGYKLTSISLKENIEVQEIEIAEVVSMAMIKVKLLGLTTPPENIHLKVEGENMTPVVQYDGDVATIALPAFVVDPDVQVDVGLDIEKPLVRFLGSVVLTGDRLVAGGSCDGPVVEAKIVTQHTIGLTTFSVSMPTLKPLASKVLSQQTTEVIIRKGMPSAIELHVTVKDVKGMSLSGAEVEVTGSGVSLRGLTDNEGIAKFIITNTTAPTLTVTASKEGYVKTEQKVNISSTLTNVELRLKKEKTVMDAVLDWIRELREYFLPLILGGSVLLVLGALKLKKAGVILGLTLIGLAVFSILL